MACGWCCNVTTRPLSALSGSWNTFDIVIPALYMLSVAYVVLRLIRSYSTASNASVATLAESWATIGSRTRSQRPLLGIYYAWLTFTALCYFLEALAILAKNSSVLSVVRPTMWCIHALMDVFPMAFMLGRTCTAAAVRRQAYMAVAVAGSMAALKASLLHGGNRKFTCTWCSVFFPEPSNRWELFFFTALFGCVWLAHAALARFRNIALGRPDMVRWVRFMCCIYGMACIGSVFVSEGRGGAHDAGYCIVLLPVLLYASSYALVMHHVFLRDSEYVLAQRNLVNKNRQLAPLLGAAGTGERSPFVVDAATISLHERVGAGGFGVVHRAEWNGLEVAVKRLHGTWGAEATPQDETDLEVALAREVAVLAAVRHPNVCSFLGVCTVQADVWLVLEFMPHSLEDLVHKSSEPIAWRYALHLLRDAARGLAYLHSCAPPIIHRDIKTSNLLISERRCKIADFGIARPMAESTMQHTNVGSVHYCAPEVLRSEPYSVAADVFSFGMVMWEVLTRKRPFQGHAVLAIAHMVAYQSKRLPLPPQCPSVLRDLLDRCWRADAAQRPTMQQVLDALLAIDDSTLQPPLPELHALCSANPAALPQ